MRATVNSATVPVVVALALAGVQYRFVAGTCESGFSVDANSVQNETDDGVCGEDGICVSRWKYVCDNCENCTRAAVEGPLEGVWQYYDFRAASPSAVTVNSSNRLSLLDNITKAFIVHTTSCDIDLTATMDASRTGRELGDTWSGTSSFIEHLGKCDDGRTLEEQWEDAVVPSGCAFRKDRTVVNDFKCKDFSLPLPACYAVSFLQVHDLLKQASGKEFLTLVPQWRAAGCLQRKQPASMETPEQDELGASDPEREPLQPWLRTIPRLCQGVQNATFGDGQHILSCCALPRDPKVPQAPRIQKADGQEPRAAGEVQGSSSAAHLP